MRDWVKQADVDAGERNGLTSSEREELAASRRENRRLREDAEVLKRAQLSSRRRPGDGAPVHRGGKAGRPQRQTGV
ncbi:hypothetical protein GCM10010518_05150 [Kitasatospora cinereorecta]